MKVARSGQVRLQNVSTTEDETGEFEWIPVDTRLQT
jgi:hypothetical protein